MYEHSLFDALFIPVLAVVAFALMAIGLYLFEKDK